MAGRVVRAAWSRASARVRLYVMVYVWLEADVGRLGGHQCGVPMTCGAADTR